MHFALQTNYTFNFQSSNPNHHHSICIINETSKWIDLFEECSLIIWDEIPMWHQHCPKAIDCILHDIHRDDKPFGGLTIVFGGDFHKNFLVIVKGSKGQIITSSLQRSSLWHNILKLQQNMWLVGTSLENQQFAIWLL